MTQPNDSGSSDASTALRALLQGSANPQHPEPTPTAPPAATSDDDAGSGEKDWKAEAEKFKALSRKNEADKKANADKARLWDEFQQQQKTETERLSEAKAAAERDAAEARVELVRVTVANEKGVPAQLLTGSTKEELEASADALLAFKGATQPALDLGQGNQGPATPPDLSANAWIRQAARGGRRYTP